MLAFEHTWWRLNLASNTQSCLVPCGRLIKDPTVLFIFLRFYLFIHERHREKENTWQRHRQRQKQAPCKEPDMGLGSGSPGSGPGLKAALNRRATRAAQIPQFSIAAALEPWPRCHGYSFIGRFIQSPNLLCDVRLLTLLHPFPYSNMRNDPLP